MSLAAFIISYERASTINSTLDSIFMQTHPPIKILVVDNSASDDTRLEVLKRNDSRVEYHRVGYNAGPAGAAKIGLEKLSQEGFDWIYWGDDNNPPLFHDSFERLLKLADSQTQVGVVGAVGQYFDFNKGLVNRVKDEEIQLHDFLPVDFVAGGMTMLVSANVARQNIFPDPELFFGNEELDFCTQVKRGRFNILVDCSLFWRSRQQAGKVSFKPKAYIRKTDIGLRREYYSLRNSLRIAEKNKLVKMKLHLHLRWIAKMMYGFRYGFTYGFSNAQFIMLAFKDYHFGNFGMTIKLR